MPYSYDDQNVFARILRGEILEVLVGGLAPRPPQRGAGRRDQLAAGAALEPPASKAPRRR